VSDNVIDFKKHQQQASHAKKEAGIQKIKQQFETAMPLEKNSADKRSLFKKKKINTRTPKKK
jgi:hypothetical protein